MRTDHQWEALAGEYVIGTLPAQEQKVYDNILRHDLDFRERVAHWQQTLSPLDSMLDPIEPDQRVWEQIAAALDFDATSNVESAEVDPAPADLVVPAPKKVNQVVQTKLIDSIHDDSLDLTDDHDLSDGFDDSDLSGKFADESGHFGSGQTPVPRQSRHEHHRTSHGHHRSRHEHRRSGLGLMGFVCGLLVAGLCWWQAPLLQQMANRYLPEDLRPALVSTTTAVTSDVAAVIMNADSQPAWMINGSVSAREIDVTALALPEQIPNKSFELWLVRDDQRDWVSVGTLSMQPGEKSRFQAQGLRSDIVQFVVSIEEPGGSTEGRPTSELLFRGNTYSIE